MANRGKKGRSKVLKRMLLSLLALFVVTSYLFAVSERAALPDPLPFDNSALADINGIRFHYRTYPPKDGADKGKLLLVHGLAGSTFSFDTAAPLICAGGYLVVSVDLPGFGYSDRSPLYDHSQKNRARDLWQLLSLIDRGLDSDTAVEPWHLAGHSMGGGTVAAMAMQAPQRTTSAIFIDAALFESPRGIWPLAIPLLDRWVLLTLENILLTEKRITGLLASAYGTEPAPEQVEGYLAPLRLPGTARALLNFIRTAENEDPKGLRGLNVPILAVWGSEDTWVPREELNRLIAIRPDTVARLIEEAVHCPMETHPEAFADIVLKWLSEPGSDPSQPW